MLWKHLKSLPAFRALLRAVEARYYQPLLPLEEPVLDVGCGDGHFASIALPERLASGVDPDARMLREARDRGAYGLLAQSVGGALPHADGHFATVISNSVLEHIPEVDPVLREIARVLRGPEANGSTRAGRFIFCVPSEHFAELLFFSQWFRRWGLDGMARAYERYFNRISRHHHCDAPEVWESRLGEAGLALKSSFYYFSERAHHALDLGHYSGVPNLIWKKAFGRWVLAPNGPTVAILERRLRPLYEEPLPEVGAYLFFEAEKV
ncbi:class I SAM-dependent methyltransferase [Chloroflexota bacterium]